MTINQISVFLENKAGQLAQITAALKENNINLRAISIAETEDYGVVRLIAEDNVKAEEILKANDYIVTLTKVVVAGVPDRRGGLNEVLELFAANDIDIEYMYSIINNHKYNNGEIAYMVFKVAEPKAVAAMLDSHGIKVACRADLGMG